MLIHFQSWLINRQRGCYLLLAMAAVGCYLPFLGNPFVFDDLSFFNQLQTAYWADSVALKLRWVPYTSLAQIADIVGGATLPHAFRLASAVMHAATAMLLFALLRQLLIHFIGRRVDDADINWVALLGAMMFALHPVATYAAGYAVQLSILMATFFCLLMQWAFLRALTLGKQRWLLLSLAAYFFACFSKEHSVAAPLILLACCLGLREKMRLRRGTLLLVACAYFAIGVLIFLRTRGVFGAPYEPMAAHLFEQSGVTASGQVLHLQSVLTQAGLFFKYLFLWIWPDPAWMSIDMRADFVNALTRWQSWIGIAAFIAFGMTAATLLFSGGALAAIGFAMIYPWLMFLPEMSSIRVQEPFVLYRSYLWMPGFMLLFSVASVVVCHRLNHQWKRGFFITLMMAAGICLANGTSNRLTVGSDPYALWDDAARLLRDDHQPGADRILYNRGNAALASGRITAAVSDLERVVKISPQLYQVRYGLGLAYLANADNRHAEQAFQQAIGLQPTDGSLHYGRAVALMRLQRDDEGWQELTTACELKYMNACLASAHRKVERGSPH